MSEPNFLVLQKRLAQRGLDPRYAKRLAAELAEHYDDLLEEAQRTGILLPVAPLIAGLNHARASYAGPAARC